MVFSPIISSWWWYAGDDFEELVSPIRSDGGSIVAQNAPFCRLYATYHRSFDVAWVADVEVLDTGVVIVGSDECCPGVPGGPRDQCIEWID